MNEDQIGKADRWHIELPHGGRFESANPSLVGWFATPKDIDFDQVILRCRAEKIPIRRELRPDVEATVPGHSVLGFNCRLQAVHLSEPDPTIRLELNGDLLWEIPLSVSSAAIEAITGLRAARGSKRQWCLDHARCPACKHPQLDISADRIVCARCSTVYPQSGESINFLSEDLYRANSLEETANVSMNPYDPTGWELVHAAAAAGGKVLDCGAGLRTMASETVVNLDIIDVPSTDVVGVGQSLPFRDGCFDVVFSHAVLEHVSDPFACAREIVRVLKPNGHLYVSAPFLSPEHGYPNHFYNMTREGLRNLFPDLVVVRHEVPSAGSPIVGLHWMIRLYAAHLGEQARAKFLGMTMGELISRGQFEYANDEVVRGLSTQGTWELACTTALVATKPG